MSDVGEDYKVLRKQRQAEHQARCQKNIQGLRDAGIEFVQHETSLVIREPGRPRADFFPHTGRWKNIENNKFYSGGVTRFLQWYYYWGE